VASIRDRLGALYGGNATLALVRATGVATEAVLIVPHGVGPDDDEERVSADAATAG
jgi:hypothetical protein